jgi:short-subunit dehydrogenase
MQRQGRGVIINVCSIAGKVGTPSTAIYNATKFGLDGFSQALRRELLPQGVHVCTIYPGPTAGTEFGARTGPRPVRIQSPGWLRTNTDAVARAIVGLADRPRARRVVPWPYQVVVAVNVVWPGLVDVIVARAAARARAAAGSA